MKHSGLQKSISSIFDGTEPIKQETTATQNPVAAATSKPQPVGPTVTSPVAGIASPAAAATLQSTPISSIPYTHAATPQTTKSATRPRPVPKKKPVSHNAIAVGNLWTTIKSRLAGGSKNALDSRQKKTLILGVALAIVFVIVLLFVFGSSPSSANAALKKSGTDESLSANSQSANVEKWKQPEIYPLSLRDPMKPSSSASGNAQSEGEMTVRGIVYSSNKPSAIIANQIVGEGDVIVGVKIIKIGKDFVAFEKNGKRWQQQVRQ
jgi:hypothetical protein